MSEASKSGGQDLQANREGPEETEVTTFFL